MKFLRPKIIIIIIIILFAISFIIPLPSPCLAKEAKISMFLWNGETDAENGFKDAIKEELPDWGIEYQMLDTCKSDERLKSLITTIDESNVDLIYGYGSTITSRLVKNFKTKPIVFNIVFDPITYKIIESWDKKQPNLTGASNSIPFPILIDKIHEVFGQGDIGLIFNPLDRKSVELKDAMNSYLEQLGLQLLSFEFKEDFGALSSYLNNIRGRCKCIYLPTEHLVIGYIERIMGYINKEQIPTCVTGKAYLSRGALLCISADYYDVGKMAGKVAAQVLKGVSPSDIPIQRPTASNLSIYVNNFIVNKFNLKLPEGLKIEYVK